MTDSTSADGALVGRFLSLKRQVIDRCEDNPLAILQTAKGDEAFRRLCIELYWAARTLQYAENQASDGIISNVNPVFVREWRDFEKRMSTLVSHIYLCDMLDIEFVGDPSRLIVDDRDEEDIRDLAQFRASSLEAVFDYLHDRMHYADGDFLDLAENGVEAWNLLTKKAWLELEGVFRRIELAPSLLAPSHAVSTSEGVSLLEKWKDARKAYLFGAPYASIAMIRATLESVLKDVYGLGGDNLWKMIKSFEGAAADSQSKVSSRRLAEIKLVANAILHVELRHKNLSEFDAAYIRRALSDIENWVAGALLVLRSLIEELPSGIHRRAVESNDPSPQGGEV